MGAGCGVWIKSWSRVWGCGLDHGGRVWGCGLDPEGRV